MKKEKVVHIIILNYANEKVTLLSGSYKLFIKQKGIRNWMPFVIISPRGNLPLPQRNLL